MNLLLATLLTILPPQKDESHVDRISIQYGVVAIVNDEALTEIHFQPAMLTKKVRKWYWHSKVYDVYIVTVLDHYDRLRTYTTKRLDK